MLRWGWLCIITVLSCFNAQAIEAVTSYTIFYIPANNTYKPYIELYWQIDPRTVMMEQHADSMWWGMVDTKVTLSTDTGIVAADAFTLQTPAASSNILAASQTILDLHRYSVPAGKIKLVLEFTDKKKPQNVYSYSDSFTVATATTTPFYSGIQLLDTTYTSASQSIFQKNDRLQIPLSVNFIGDERSKLRFYTELYQSNTYTGSLTQNTYISKKSLDKPVYGLITTDTIKPAAVIPFSGVFDISALPSGNYYLNIALLNEAQEQVAARSFFFQRSNTNPSKKKDADTTLSNDTSFAPIYKVNVFDLANTFVGKFSVAQLRAILKMLQPIASANENNNILGFLESPDQTYMQYFVYNFFKERNPEDPGKAWQEYTEKVKEVNKLFGGSSTRGYETDRGQIYLKYGKPNERVIVLNEPGSLPYEVWQYNAPGKQSSQGILLFYRPPYVIGDMILLHTTVNGEVRNTQWRNMLFTGSQMQSSNSRAAQYLPFR